MKCVMRINYFLILFPLLWLASCGGESAKPTNIDSTNPSLGAVVDQATESYALANIQQPSLGTATLTGRVADGYIFGALLCVDGNENGQCDDNEPQTTSGAGGAFALDVPVSMQGKPIVASVPANAIDEDTGEPVGKAFVMSTPGDMPEFVSPITTLVHQELQNNPSLSTDAAEATVLENLGMSDEAPASLFTDYIASSDEGDAEMRDKFKHLHQTARVVASMMGEMQQSVNTAAVNKGLDIEQNEDTKKAARELVREEIRQLLPQISSNVATQFLEAKQAEEFITDPAALPSTLQIDTQSVIQELNIELNEVAIAGRIESMVQERPFQQAAMRAILEEGIYMIDMDCDKNANFEKEDGVQDSGVKAVALVLNDDGSPTIADRPRYCDANYTHVVLEAGSDAIGMQQYALNANTSEWALLEPIEQNKPELILLTENGWQPVSEQGPTGIALFNDDGSVELNSGEGKMLINGVSRDLSSTPVIEHMYNRGAGDALLSFVQPGIWFSENSAVHNLHIRRKSALSVLFHWWPAEDDSQSVCAQYDGNCNVIGIDSGDAQRSDEFVAISSLDELLLRAPEGVVVKEYVRDYTENLPINIELKAELDANGTFQHSGKARWVLAPLEGVQSQTGKPTEPAEPQMLGESKWSLVEKEGVRLIEIKIPIVVRHRIRQDEFALLLLAEHDGFVRRGARINESSVDNDTAYSSNAFNALKPVIENYVVQ